MRKFDTGATRDNDDNKLDYEGFLSPLVLERYAQYMHQHRKQADGTMRDSDNWKKGVPVASYQKSLIRHTMEAWTLWRNNYDLSSTHEKMSLEDTLCAILFNTMGYLHEIQMERDSV